MDVKGISNLLSRARLLYLYCATIFISFMGMWFWYSSIYQSLEQSERQLIATIETLEKKRLVLPDLNFQIQSLKQNNIHLKNDYTSRLLRYPLQDFYLQLERILTDLDDVGLDITSFSPQDTEKKAFYEKNLISFKVQGDFEHIMNFLSLFSERNMLAVFKKAAIIRDEDDLTLDSTIALYNMGRDG